MPIHGPPASTNAISTHDGKLSLEEFMATASGKATAKERFEKFDLDKDGFVSREEFVKQGKK